MSEVPEPDWSLLPDDPEAFFGLEEGYERKTLKRAYTRLIKRFKPETRPNEFRRIRAAYEALDNALRYGESTVRPMVDIGGASGEDTATGQTRPLSLGEPDGGPGVEEEAHRESAQERAAAWLAELGPEATLKRLREVVGSDPALWCSIALLEDALSEDPLAAVKALIEGLRSCGPEPAIINLLREFLLEEHGPKESQGLLIELLKAVRQPGVPGGIHGAVYWSLTDDLWTKLVTRVKFEGFAKLLDRCQRHIGDDGRGAWLVLMLRLRRRAMLCADQEWLDEVDEELDRSHVELPPWAEEEYDLAEWLSAYRTVREDFVDGSEIRDIFDAAISAIVVGDDLEADRLFLEAQVACFEREDEVNESFAGIEIEVRVALNVLEWYCHDWRERAGIDGDMDAGYRQAMEFSRRLDRRSDRSWVGRLWNFTLLGVMGLVVAVVIGVAMWLRERVGDVAIALPFVVLVVVIAGFQRGWFWRPLQLVSKPFVAWQSRKLWRPMTLDFLRESRVPFLLLVSVLEEEEAPTDAFVLQAVATDLSLGMHSIAARTLV